MSKILLVKFFQFGVLAYLTFMLGFFALLGVLIGGNDLFFHTSYRSKDFSIQSLAYFLLGAGGILGLIGLWVATLFTGWYLKAWLRRLLAMCLLGGIASGVSQLYFGWGVLMDWNPQSIGALELLVVPIFWGCLLLAKMWPANLAIPTQKGLEQT